MPENLQQIGREQGMEIPERRQGQTKGNPAWEEVIGRSKGRQIKHCHLRALSSPASLKEEHLATHLQRGSVTTQGRLMGAGVRGVSQRHSWMAHIPHGMHDVCNRRTTQFPRQPSTKLRKRTPTQPILVAVQRATTVLNSMPSSFS